MNHKVDFINNPEQEAKEFLCQYDCYNNTMYPSPVPIEEIAEKMGLHITDEYMLARNTRDMRGFTTFVDGTTTVYTDDGSPVELYFDRGELFVDSRLETYEKRNVIAHECYHWYKHKDFFLNRYTSTSLAEPWDTTKDSANKGGRSDEKIVEWQACTMAPKILMPRDAAKLLLGYYLDEENNLNAPFYRVLCAFSTAFQVSKQSACIRLKELKCPDAKEYYNKVYTSEHYSFGENHYWIPPDEALKLYIENDSFYQLISSGEYIYTSDYFVVKNVPEFFIVEEANRYASEYAMLHPDECMLPLQDYLFPEQIISSLGIGFNARGAGYQTVFKEMTGFNSNAKRSDQLAERVRHLQSRLAKPMPLFANPGALLWEHISDLGWSRKDFEDATGLGKNTYYRLRDAAAEDKMRASDPSHIPIDYNFDFVTLLTVCYGLELGMGDVNAILEYSDFQLKSKNPQHRAYSFCLDYCKKFTLDEANEILISAGLKPFASEKS